MTPLPADYYATDDPVDDADDSERTYKGYKDRYTGYYGVDWPGIRQQVLDRDDFRCQGCGLTDQEHRERDDLFGGGLHIHHEQPAKDFDSRAEANALSNLTALCADCHRAAENGQMSSAELSSNKRQRRPDNSHRHGRT